MTAADGSSGTGTIRVRRRRRRRRGTRWLRRLRRRVPKILLGLAFVTVAVGAVLAAAVWQKARAAEFALAPVRDQVQRVAADVQAIQTPDGRASDIRQLQDARAATEVVRQGLRDSLAIRLFDWIPIANRQGKGLVQAADDIGHGIEIANALLIQVNDAAAQTRITGGALPTGLLPKLAADSGAAGRGLAALVRPAGSLVGPLQSSRRNLNSLLARASDRLLRASDGLSAADRFVGGGVDHRYLLALENNAEMRDQGMVLSYVEVRFTKGAISFGQHGSVDDIELKQPAPTPIPPGTQQVFGALYPTQTWQSVNPGADFAWSGRAMADMFTQITAQSTDGVIALDVPTLASLLGVIGPIQVTGISTPLTADNVARVLLNDLYATFPPTVAGSSARHERLADVASVVIDHLRHGSFDAFALGRAFSQQVAGGHLRLWSRDEPVEHTFEQLGVAGGAATADPGRTFHVAVENRASNKLDYFLQVGVDQQIDVTAAGDAIVHTVVTLHNMTPAGQPASLQIGPDVYGTTSHPGDYLAWALLWGPSGSKQSASVAEGGLNLSQAVLLVPAAQSRAIRFITVIPHAVSLGVLTLRYVPQPRLTPETWSVTVNGATPSNRTWNGPLDRVQVLHFPIPG